jgi:hypothetical protein
VQIAPAMSAHLEIWEMYFNFFNPSYGLTPLA